MKLRHFLSAVALTAIIPMCLSCSGVKNDKMLYQRRIIPYSLCELTTDVAINDTMTSVSSQTKYSYIDESSIKSTVNLADKGLVADSKDNAQNNALIINKAIKEASDFTKITFPKGTFYIDSYIVLQNKSNLILQGDETLLINTAYAPLTELTVEFYPKSTFFKIDSCRDITVKGFTLDYLSHSTIDGKIEKVGGGKTVFKAYSEFTGGDKNPIKGNELVFSALVADENVFYNEAWLPEGTSVTKESGTRLYSIPTEIGKEGDRICCRISCGTYASPAIYVTYTRGFVLNDITCHSCPSAFIYAPYGNCDFDISGLDVSVEESSKRLLSSNEDILHIKQMSGVLRLADSKFCGLGDDVLNVHSKLAKLEGISDNTATIIFPDAGSNVAELFFLPDEYAEFFDGTGKSLGTSKILGVSGDVATFEAIPENVTDGCFVMNVSCLPDTLVDNCDISFGRARGVLLQTKNAVVQNCTFSNMRLSGVLACPDFENWYEAGFCDNLLIRNNVFDNCASLNNGFGAVHISTSHDNPWKNDEGIYHKNVSVIENSFKNCKSQYIKYAGVGNFKKQ